MKLTRYYISSNVKEVLSNDAGTFFDSFNQAYGAMEAAAERIIEKIPRCQIAKMTDELKVTDLQGKIYKWKVKEAAFELTPLELSTAYHTQEREYRIAEAKRHAVKLGHMLSDAEANKLAIRFTMKYDRDIPENTQCAILVEDKVKEFPDSYFVILQLNKENKMLMFERYEAAKEMSLHYSNYDAVWKEEYHGEDLDEIFARFNIDRPDDFKGHSLSVSDVIVIKETPESPLKCFYVDSFGFEELPDDFLETY